MTGHNKKVSMDKVKPRDYFMGRKIEPQVGDGAPWPWE